MNLVLMDVKSISNLSSASLSDLADQVGNTPIKPIGLTIDGRHYPIHLKLESMNPTGSVKDRTGLGLIQWLELQGSLQPGSTVIESTSGNLGVALALQCRVRGYKFVAVVDPKTTPENINKMRALGAQIDVVDQPDINGGYLLTRLERIQQLCAVHPDYIWSNQYGSLANPRIHANTTAPEIYEQMQGDVDVIFIAVSTGGTLTGVSRYFRAVSPHTRIIGVDAVGSIIFGTQAGPRLLTGIGSSRASSFITAAAYDEYMLIDDHTAFAFCRELDTETGIKVGGSSGAVLSACARYLSRRPEEQRIVCLCADGGENYASSLFSDEWLEAHGMVIPAQRSGRIHKIVE
ncbi:hypothetical protein KDA_67840 [Dictyobacter alpinus]|uniref:N-(2-amino-2-carboxyethyl)-L-glutamate synthase n=1 Tax=Dictyobacter alpinus TaxID=2014873 RepID=A0A402BIZ0_9CHLR|nr:2,3-diaminopropionate biosynthesis protein SbnA [Dictyobacter alpinus]GCE31300.1 hypothetical protein KDA_67840 [Dictyobacter alpinus]